MIVTEHTNILSDLRAFVPSRLRVFVPSCLRAFVPSGLRAFVPSCLRAACLRAFVSLQCVIPSLISLHTSQLLIISSTVRLNLQFLLHLILHLHSQNQQSVMKTRHCQTLQFTLRAEVSLSDCLLPITVLTRFMLFLSQGLLSCENHYREALRLRPHYVAAWENLGLVLLNTSKNA